MYNSVGRGMGLYLYIALVSLGGSLRSMFLFMYMLTNLINKYMIMLLVIDTT